MPSGSMGDVERHHCHWKKLWSCLIMVTNIKGTLPGTDIFAPAKIDGWNMRFPLGGKRPMFRGELLLGGGFSNIFGIFTPNLGDDSHFDLRIFCNWVGSTTNQVIFRECIINPRPLMASYKSPG